MRQFSAILPRPEVRNLRLQTKYFYMMGIIHFAATLKYQMHWFMNSKKLRKKNLKVYSVPPTTQRPSVTAASRAFSAA
jgi:hypothetical protein